MLEQLQDDFLQSLTEKNGQPAFLKHIKNDGQLSAQDRLNIYHESITECMANALREIYPVCEKLVGEAFFTGMAYQYIQLTPSHSPNLFDYGHCFAAFASNFKPAQSLPYLPDICRLEWARHLAYYAAKQHVLDIGALAKITKEKAQHNIRFALPTESTLIQSDYPIYRIWETNQAGYQDNDGSHIHLDEGNDHLIVWRKNNDVRIDCLTPNEWQLLHAISQGMRLGDITQQIMQQQLAVDITALLPKLIEHGWVAGFAITA